MADVPAASSAAPNTATPSPAPASPSPAPASSAPASTPEGSAAPATPTEPGPIPYSRFKEVNDQLKAARDYQQKYGWATQFEQDPYTFVENWVDQLANHPQYGPQIVGKMARMLGSRRGQTAANEEPQPDVPIVDGAGNVTGQTYSAAQLKKWRDWDWSQRQATLDQRLGPLEQQVQQAQAREAYAQLAAQSEESARTTLSELRQDPYFSQYEGQVKQALVEHPEWGDDVYRAYHHVQRTVIFPQIGQTAEARVLANLHTQAAASTPNPGSAATATPKFKDFGEALRYYGDPAHKAEAEAMAKR